MNDYILGIHFILYLLCVLDVNECDFSGCFNNGTCENTPGSFTCRCLPGFEGHYCDRSESITHCSLRLIVVCVFFGNIFMNNLSIDFKKYD